MFHLYQTDDGHELPDAPHISLLTPRNTSLRSAPAAPGQI